MSQQAIEQFLQATKQNEALLAKLAVADSASSVVKIAAELGYEFTESELTAVAEKMRFTSDSEELSDDELETISGGHLHGVGNGLHGIRNGGGCKW